MVILRKNTGFSAVRLGGHAPNFADRLAEKAGLTADLRAVFGGNMEMVNA